MKMKLNQHILWAPSLLGRLARKRAHYHTSRHNSLAKVNTQLYAVIGTEKLCNSKIHKIHQRLNNQSPSTFANDIFLSNPLKHSKIN